MLADEPELPVSVPSEPEPPVPEAPAPEPPVPVPAPEPAAVPVSAPPVCAPAAVPSVLPGVVPELVGSVVVGELLISDVASCNVHTVFMNVSSNPLSIYTSTKTPEDMILGGFALDN